MGLGVVRVTNERASVKELISTNFWGGKDGGAAGSWGENSRE
jgi:hypothetical protein